MSNATLKNDINRYFDDRLQSAGPIEFDDVTGRAVPDWPLAALVAAAVVVGITAWQWPGPSSTLKDELIATTSWHSDTDVFLEYQSRRFLYETPKLEIE